MSKKSIHQLIFLYATIALAVLLPFGKLVPIPIVVLFLNWLIEGDFKMKWKNMQNNKLVLVLPLFYVLHVFGLFTTSNSVAGLFDLEVKLSLFILPLIFASKPLNAEDFAKLRYFFVISLLCVGCFLLLKSSWTYLNTGVALFSYTSFSTLLHPSYFSMYLNVGLLFCWFEWKNPFFFRKKVYLILAAFFLVLLIVLSASKMGMFSCLLFVAFAAFKLFYERFNKWLAITSVLILLSSLLFVAFSVPSLKNRIHWMIEAVTSPTQNTSAESSAVRINVWKSAVELIVEDPLIGYGTGDVKQELTKRYQKNKMSSAFEHEYNAHNVFLQTGVALGLLGLFTVLFLCFAPFFISDYRKKDLFLFFLVLITLNFLVESMLDRQAGVIFTAFFYSILATNFELNSKEKLNVNLTKT